MDDPFYIDMAASILNGDYSKTDEEWADDSLYIDMSASVLNGEHNKMDDEWSDDSLYIDMSASLLTGLELQQQEEYGGKRKRDDDPRSPTSDKMARTQWDTSDSEPLRQQVSPPDNTVDDPLYSPEEDCLSSDSSVDKTTTVETEKRTHRLTKHERNAARKSLREVKQVQRETRIHTSRLDNVLSANGFKRMDVPADGNCFFEACAITTGLSGPEIRQHLCDYLETDFASFIDFLQIEDENERYLQYFHNVAQLRKPGHWNNDGGDLLPSVFATWMGKTVRLFSSSPSRPVIDIHPVNSEKKTLGDVFPLAFLEIPGTPHYNVCIPLDQNVSHSTVHTTTSAVSGHSSSTPAVSEHSSSTPAVSEHSSSTPAVSGHSSSTPAVSGHSSSTPAVSGHSSSTPAVSEHSSSTPAVSGHPSSTPAVSGCPPALEVFPLSPVGYCQSQDNEGTQTPRKQACYKTPPKRLSTRKRLAQPQNWRKNLRRKLKLQGKGYVSTTNTYVPEKVLKDADCSSCSLQCGEIEQEQRKELFDMFYSLDSKEKQKQFLCTQVQECRTKQFLNEDNEPIMMRRNVFRKYFLNVSGQKMRVCKGFFMATLGIGHGVIDHALRNSKAGLYLGQNGRGRHQPHNKTSAQALERAKEHINSFPVMPSHYTRKDSKRQYLAPELNIKKMYSLHTEDCRNKNMAPVSTKVYRKLFNEGFNLSFHTPKKDQCATCTLHASKKKEDMNAAEVSAFQEHLRRKQRVREEKEKDKRAAIDDHTKHVVTMDLQAVLQAPCGLVSQLYYKRKLSVYNFTVYSLSDGHGTCFTWNEAEGMRGSNEIATCVYIYLSSLPSTVKEVIIYSDCCGGQNRNQNLTAALIFAVNTIANIRVITQKFLETGHTQMECDSMHAAISTAKKTTSIHSPSGWDIVLRMARRKKPYTIIPLTHRSFYDFKGMAAATIKNKNTDTHGNPVNWLHIKCIQVVKGQEEFMSFKSDLDEDFRVVRLSGSCSKKTKKTATSKLLKLCYSRKLPISEAKKRDLMSLCSSGIIPEEHHSFYALLPVSGTVQDRLPQPDSSESSSCDMD